MAIPVVSQIYNPITGVFGTGQMQIFASSGIWTVPPGINKVRARVWGAGGGNGGGGGGFAIRTVWDLTGVSVVGVTVGAGSTSANGGTSSFGSYVSATGGVAAGGAGGAGVGGDINNSGGQGTSGVAGGGVGSVIGIGGGSAGAAVAPATLGGAGGGISNPATMAANGFLGRGALGSAGQSLAATSGLTIFSIDFIGTGGGGNANIQNGINGGGAGGGGQAGRGGIPGGGGASGLSGRGLVIVEW